MTPRPDLRPADRRRCGEDDLLVGETRRRLAAPLPRRLRGGLAVAPGDRGAQPRRHGQRLRGRRGRAAVRRCSAATAAPSRRASTPTSSRSTCPYTGEVLADRLRQARQRRDPRPARRSRGQRAAGGHRRGAEGGGAGRRARAGDGRGDRGRPGPTPATPVFSPSDRHGRGACAGWRASLDAQGHDKRDNAFYEAWDAIARYRDSFTGWVRENILEQGPEAFARSSRK